MRIKIYKRHQHFSGVWLPYFVIQCDNVTPEEYAKMHSESEYKNCKYEIIKKD